ncbi:craniofacial development protein 2-like [Eupeodes corollae]|uniref:craniofacial development protein 2-like n=1 Tax=Eupeodes corollae TaxID=290404 RepID=UPI0024927945|nr:craniofacial development protein 2-like [Eupeodes corollae]
MNRQQLEQVFQEMQLILLALVYTYKIGAWNVRSLYGEGRYEQLEREMLLLKISILGISKTKWRGRAEYRSDTGQTRMLYSGEDEREGVQKLHGVGSLILWEPLEERLIQARFQSRVRPVTVIQCYAPTELASNEEKDCIYSQLGSAYNSIPRGDIILLMGDLNAKIFHPLQPENVSCPRFSNSATITTTTTPPPPPSPSRSSSSSLQ